jgi:hypothetical protein
MYLEVKGPERGRSKRPPGYVHGRITCTPTRDLHQTLTRYYSTNMDSIEAALKDLKL